MRFEEVKIGPELARAMLDASGTITNRSIRQNKVRSFAHAMQDGRWEATHQPIAVSPDGIVFDGWHRLLAIIEADVEVEIGVMYDARPETFGLVDVGTTRTMADSLKIAGVTDPNVTAAAVRAFLTYDQVVDTTDDWRGAHAIVTTDDVLAYLDTDEAARVLPTAMHDGRACAHAFKLFGLRTTMTAVSMIFRTRRSAIGLDAQAEFWARVTDGAMLPTHSPILALRKWIAGAATGLEGLGRVGNHERHPTVIAATIKTVNDWHLGIERSTIRWYPGRNVMPHPTTRAETNRFQREREEHLEEIERRDEEGDR